MARVVGPTLAPTTALIAAAGATRAGYAALRPRPPGGAARWERTNHAGRTVTLHAGPATAPGTALAAAGAPGLSARTRGATALVAAAAGDRVSRAAGALWPGPRAPRPGGSPRSAVAAVPVVSGSGQ
ncbi:hypothetical protein [Streptomyces sp. YGL11-2]|uniref:hypothetical protein n=1 Tax=Streptomyces sp. YGL11-2 TaxID=3414028 RepID=UPI003CEC7FC6